MRVRGAVAVVTGGAGGIGQALARRLLRDGARAVVLADVAPIGTVPDGAVAVTPCDVTDPTAVDELVSATLARYGRVDLFFSNAGVLTGLGVEDADPGDRWHRAYDVNVMATVYAARAVLPCMLEQGTGYLCITASAAGLLTSPGDAAYAATKHAAVGLGEWLAVTYGDRGIGVSVVCPFGVATPLLLDPLRAGVPAAQVVAASGEIIGADRVADAIAEGIAADRFLITPHPEVAGYWAQKAGDVERWLAGVRRLTARHPDH